MKSFEVVIVGGGPAGASLGYMLVRAGFSVCIIEKEKLPRFKLCGGLLTEKSMSYFEELYGEKLKDYKKKTSKVSIYLGNEKISSAATDSEFTLVERAEFDALLIRNYQNVGGAVFEGCEVTRIEVKEKRVLTSSGEEIAFQIIVGADGANSITRKLIDKKYRPNGVCIEADFDNERDEQDICIYFSFVNNGYGWSFPKGSYSTVGIGGTQRTNRRIHENFREFIHRTRSDRPINTTRGALIPYGSFVKHPGKGPVLLIGDAAGLVDPITGEGIYFAFNSAQLAFKAILSTKNQNFKGCSVIYRKEVRTIQKIIKSANIAKMAMNIVPLRNFILGLIKGKTNIIKYTCRYLISNYRVSYLGFPFKYTLARIARKMNEED